MSSQLFSVKKYGGSSESSQGNPSRGHLGEEESRDEDHAKSQSTAEAKVTSQEPAATFQEQTLDQMHLDSNLITKDIPPVTAGKGYRDNFSQRNPQIPAIKTGRCEGFNFGPEVSVHEVSNKRTNLPLPMKLSISEADNVNIGTTVDTKVSTPLCMLLTPIDILSKPPLPLGNTWKRKAKGNSTVFSNLTNFLKAPRETRNFKTTALSTACPTKYPVQKKPKTMLKPTRSSTQALVVVAALQPLLPK